MYRCPNDTYIWKFSKETEKKNQIGRRFSEIFDKLLDPNYYEGTPYGNNYNRLNPDGTSKIYVKDPLEKRLCDFCNMRSNTINYLVGFTGMGKTTLLRNFFKIYNRDVKIEKNEIVVYISFYYSNLCADYPQGSVEDEVIKYLLRTISKLGQLYPNTIKDEDRFWNEFYEYIECNKPTNLQNEDIIPGISFSELFGSTCKVSIEQKKVQLGRACKKNRLDYHASMLKYLLAKAQEIHTVYFIFDDIESKEGIFHRPVVEVARHLHSCFSCMEGGNIIVKTLVSLRAYTFRSNIDRQLEARREQIEKNTIFKKNTADLREIFNLRFNELSNELEVEKKAKEKTALDAAVKQIEIVTRQISSSFSDIIINLANCNLCNAMVMYNTVLTNVEWVGKQEKENSGKFQVSADSYKVTAKTVFNALACGNEITYSDKFNNFFPNLLHNGKVEGEELINLLILRYLMRRNATDLYGETYVERSEIVQDITNVFTCSTDSRIKVDRWKDRITDSLNYLYDSGILLRSIYDIENLNDEQIERKYGRAIKFYVSPRGQFLVSLLSQNALLLELYRDSIYVDLDGNDRLTKEMRTSDVMQYLIKYVKKLFEYEKKNIGDALLNLVKYQEYFGSELLVSPLIEGIRKNVQSYFKDNCNEYDMLMEEIQLLISDIEAYILVLYNEKGVRFILTDITT